MAVGVTFFRALAVSVVVVSAVGVAYHVQKTVRDGAAREEQEWRAWQKQSEEWRKRAVSMLLARNFVCARFYLEPHPGTSLATERETRAGLARIDKARAAHPEWYAACLEAVRLWEWKP